MEIPLSLSDLPPGTYVLYADPVDQHLRYGRVVMRVEEVNSVLLQFVEVDIALVNLNEGRMALLPSTNGAFKLAQEHFANVPPLPEPALGAFADIVAAGLNVADAALVAGPVAVGLSGPAIMANLAVIGGGSALAGIGAITAAPAYVSSKLIGKVCENCENDNTTVKVTKITGAVGGAASTGIGVIAVSGAGTAGVSGAGITSGLAALGGGSLASGGMGIAGGLFALSGVGLIVGLGVAGAS